MFKLRRLALAATCTIFIVCRAYAAPAGILISATNSHSGPVARSVPTAQQLAQNAVAQLASTAAANPNTQSLSLAVNPSTGAAMAAVTPPTSASSPSQPAPNDPVTPPKAQGASVPTPAGPAANLDHKPLGDGLLHHASASMLHNPLNWAVHVYKSHHRLDVYFQGHLYKSYHAVFGRSRWAGAKEWEGDLRTPEGDYLIIAKHPSRRFGWFLRINYPNAIDESRFDHLRADHEIPRRTRAGGQIGIHGTDNPLLNVGDVNWTTGCISVDNSDIIELARLLPTGTLVVIEP